MEWLLAHGDDEGLDEPLTEEEAADWTGDKVQEAAGEEEAPARKPLTEEERKEKLEAIEKEKKRIKEGQGMSEIKQALAEQEIKKMAEERRREKMETKAAKAKILAQIEADKAARREMFNTAPPASAT